MRLLASISAIICLGAMLPAAPAVAQEHAPMHHAKRVMIHKMHVARRHMRVVRHRTRARMHHMASRMHHNM